MTTRIRRVPDGFGAPIATLTVTIRRLLTSPEVAGLLVAATRTTGGTIVVGTDLTRAEADHAIEVELLRRGGSVLDRWDVGLDEDALGDAVRWAAGPNPPDLAGTRRSGALRLGRRTRPAALSHDARRG